MRPRVGIADAEDQRVIDAVGELVARGKVEPVVVGGSSAALPTGAGHIEVPDHADALTTLAHAVMSCEVAAGVAGSTSPSAAVVRAAIRNFGHDGLVSSCFIMRQADRWVSYADCVVVPEPSVEQLAEIAWSAARNHVRLTGESARVAMLSFSTKGSAEHPRAHHVRQATQLLREQHPDLVVEGEIQFDVAVAPDVARRKAAGSVLEGDANVLVFPSLEAGNIAYKVAERLGGLHALGAFILGIDHVWVDLSRGCSVDDIVETVELLASRLEPTSEHEMRTVASR